MDFTEKTLNQKYVFNGRIMNVRVDDVILPNGKLADREVIEHNGGACIVPLTDDGEVLMVKQYRYPHERLFLEIPAGKLEKGEDHRECGLRELREETGFTCSEYTYIGKIYPVPAYDTEIIHVYMARGLRRQGEQSLDEDEFLDVVKIPLSEAVEMIMSGKLHDSKTQIAVLIVARILGI